LVELKLYKNKNY